MKIMPKAKGAANLRSLLPGSYPPPGTLPNGCLVVQRGQTLAGVLAGDRATRGLHTNHSIFIRAEAADTGLVSRNRNAGREVHRGRRTTRTGRNERVTALGAGGQNAVDQASSGGSRSARVGSAGAQVGQGSREADRRIGRV